jgi:tetratricopeptide (TPR) repeat protein
MKIVHRNKELAAGDENWLAIAKEHEREGELAEAAAAYEKLVKKKPLNEPAYNRLMMLYRQLKEYKKELRIIKQAITAFENSYKRAQKHPGKKIANLSVALAKSTGLMDRKGKSIYEPGPLARWRKRKMVVEKKVRSASTDKN